MTDTYYKMPLIGEPAPPFKAVTTQGEIRDYKGKWVYCFHTCRLHPVCTTDS